MARKANVFPSYVNGGEKSWRWAVEKCGALEWRIGCRAGRRKAHSGMEEASFRSKSLTSQSLELLRLCRAAA